MCIATGIGVSSVQEYINDTRMNRSGTWGNTEEVMALSHLLNTPVYSYRDSYTLPKRNCRFDKQNVFR